MAGQAGKMAVLLGSLPARVSVPIAVQRSSPSSNLRSIGLKEAILRAGKKIERPSRRAEDTV
jgi:hypothetical protein